MKLVRAALALFLICLASAFLNAQEKDKKSESKAVQIKVNILAKDAAGNLINDVKIEDLKIFEDGIEQKITYFAKKEPVLNLGLVIDNTGSMRLLLDKTIKAGANVTNELAKEDEAFLVRFVKSDVIELVQNWTPNKNLLLRGLENLYVEGGQSAVIDALYISTQMILEREKQNKSKRYALVLISDGEDRDSFYNEAQLYKLLKDTDIQIFSIIFPGNYQNATEKKVKSFINRLALETGGSGYFLYSGDIKNQKFDEAMLSFAKAIVADLRSQYVVGYTSTNQKRDDLPRKLVVQIADNEKGEKRQAITRESIIVPKE